MEQVQAFKKIKKLPEQYARNVLDAGCGPGSLINGIRDLLKNKRYLGIDLEQKFIDRAKEKLLKSDNNIEFSYADIMNFSGGPFDFVIVWAVLQHLPDTVAAIKKFHSLISTNSA